MITTEFPNNYQEDLDTREGKFSAYKGPKIIVGLGIQLTADENIALARAESIGRMIEDCYFNDNLHETIIFVSGGATFNASRNTLIPNGLGPQSEAESLYLYLENRYLNSNYPFNLIPIPLNSSDFNEYHLLPLQNEHGGWNIPIIIDDQAISTYQNMEGLATVIHELEQLEDGDVENNILIGLVAGQVRPSLNRAAATFNSRFRDKDYLDLLLIEAKDSKNWLKRAFRAFQNEGPIEALAELPLLEKLLTLVAKVRCDNKSLNSLATYRQG